ncbi:restriction endonuclease subunit S [Micrococcus endophyticus]|uniref:restriction endonuclease subunit S n=1 Tax=Micrococcus endophyticus TaxID=455343 RepID=UPI00381F9E3E
MSLELDKSAWKRVKLGEVVAASKEKVDPSDGSVDRFIAGEHMDTDDLKIHRWGDPSEVDLGPAFHRRFRPGQVLYGSRRTYLRKVAVADFHGVCANTTFVVETNDPRVLLQEFLPFVMTSEPFHAFAIAESKGSVNPYVNWSDIARYEFALPPLDEQKRIADLLWAVEHHRLQLESSTKSIAEAVDAHLRELWESETGKHAIGDVADSVTGTTPSKSNLAYWSSRDVPFYTPSEINGDTVGAARQRVSAAGASAGRLLPEFAVAIACIGGDLGKSAVIREPGISNQQITSIVGLTSDDAYLMQSLLAHPRGRLALEARETTTVVRKLNKSDLMKVKVPWPEDRRVVRQLVKHRRETVAAITQEALSLRALLSTLLSEIFGGEL